MLFFSSCNFLPSILLLRHLQIKPTPSHYISSPTIPFSQSCLILVALPSHHHYPVFPPRHSSLFLSPLFRFFHFFISILLPFSPFPLPLSLLPPFLLSPLRSRLRQLDSSAVHLIQKVREGLRRSQGQSKTGMNVPSLHCTLHCFTVL